MHVYNTLTRRKELFTPAQAGKVGLYTCGITAYDFSHIGHARSAVAFDVLVRFLRFKGLDVTFIRNFTDVDDKIIAKAQKEGRSSEEVARTYMDAYHEDMDRLGVCRPDIEPLATDHIEDMIRLCRILIERDRAYATASGDVYFRVRSYPHYGRLSGRSPDDLRVGVRILPGEDKEDPLDFALWKAAKPGEPSWESPWGRGRPGWHIECSAMSEKYLPLPLDIHGGGLDLIFPHHENEMAQTEAALDRTLANYWVHNGFVMVNAQKMSKSLGNFKTIRDILERCLPETLRFFLVGKHYRSPIDFSFEGLEEAERAQRRIYEHLREVDRTLAVAARKHAAGPALESLKALRVEFESLDAAFLEAMDDDCNTAAALGHVFSLARLAGRVLEEKTLRNSVEGHELLANFREATRKWERILGLFGQEPAVFLHDLRDLRARRQGLDALEVERLLARRAEARAARDFAAADAARDRLQSLGVDVRDTPEGQVWDVA